MPAVKITQKPIGIPGDDTHFLVTQPELPEGYTPTGQETEEELAELKVESVREIEMDDMVKLIQDKLDMDETPTEDSTKPITSGGIKAALDLMDDDISSLNEDLKEGKLVQDTSNVVNSYIYKATIGSAIAFSSSSVSKTIKKIIPVIYGRHYTVKIEEAASPASASSRDCAIADASNIVRQVITYTNIADTKSIIEFTAYADGYLYLCVDKNYVSIDIYGGMIYEINTSLDRINSVLNFQYSDIILDNTSSASYSGDIGDVIEKQQSVNNWNADSIDVSPGEKYLVKFRTIGYGHNNIPYVFLCDEDDYILYIIKITVSSEQYVEREITVLNNVAHLYIRSYKGTITAKKYSSVTENRIISNENGILEINQLLNKLRTIKDYSVWKRINITGNTGTSTTANDDTLVRCTSVHNNIVSMIAPTSSLVAFLYETDGDYIGVWFGSGRSLKKTNSFEKVSTLNFDEIRKEHPDCNIIVMCRATDVGKTTTYPNSNIDIVERVESTEEYEVKSLNLGEWNRGELAYSNGKLNDIFTAVYSGYVKDYIVRVRTNYSNSMRVAIYNNSGTYIGTLTAKGETVTSFSDYMKCNDIDFDLLRSTYPNCKFRITMYGVIYGTLEYNTVFDDTTMYCVVNKTKRNAYDCNLGSYHIPTRFTRDVFYSEVVEGFSVNASCQSFCTDGTYFYVGLLLDASIPYIKKIDSTGTLVATEAVLESVGHLNDMTYNPTDNKIYIIDYKDSVNKVWILDPDTLEIEDNISLQTIQEQTASYVDTPINFWSISYLEANGIAIFVLKAPGGFAIVNSSFTRLIKYIRIPARAAGSKGQASFVTNEYILMLHTDTPTAQVYDWHGNTICTYNFPQQLGTGLNEIESILELNGEWYQLWNKSSLDSVFIGKGVAIGYSDVPVASVLKQFNAYF